jgi:hypothetical protein
MGRFLDDDWRLATRCAYAAAAILPIAGCTTETESSGGGCSGPMGSSGSSELGQGQFQYKNKGASGKTEPTPLPDAFAKGAEFSVSFQDWSTDTSRPPISVRSASNDKLQTTGAGEVTAETRFVARATGLVAVLAVTGETPAVVVDLVHLRVLSPTKIRIDSTDDLPDPQKQGLAQGTLTVPAGAYATFTAIVTGEVDAAGGPLGDSGVGGTVALSGIVPSWVTSDAAIVSLAPNDDGTVAATAEQEGQADVTVTAGDLAKVVHVVVEKGASLGN